MGQELLSCQYTIFQASYIEPLMNGFTEQAILERYLELKVKE